MHIPTVGQDPLPLLSNRGTLTTYAASYAPHALCCLRCPLSSSMCHGVRVSTCLLCTTPCCIGACSRRQCSHLCRACGSVSGNRACGCERVKSLTTTAHRSCIFPNGLILSPTLPPAPSTLLPRFFCKIPGLCGRLPCRATARAECAKELVPPLSRRAPSAQRRWCAPSHAHSCRSTRPVAISGTRAL